ncbi:MAG: hypothetical protein WDO24_01910 [Pseudomonadota bacterium]
MRSALSIAAAAQQVDSAGARADAALVIRAPEIKPVATEPAQNVVVTFGGSRIRIGWRQMPAAAVFARGNSAYILFDPSGQVRPLGLQPDDQEAGRAHGAAGSARGQRRLRSALHHHGQRQPAAGARERRLVALSAQRGAASAEHRGGDDRDHHRRRAARRGLDAGRRGPGDPDRPGTWPSRCASCRCGPPGSASTPGGNSRSSTFCRAIRAWS